MFWFDLRENEWENGGKWKGEERENVGRGGCVMVWWEGEGEEEGEDWEDDCENGEVGRDG